MGALIRFVTYLFYGDLRSVKGGFMTSKALIIFIIAFCSFSNGIVYAESGRWKTLDSITRVEQKQREDIVNHTRVLLLNSKYGDLENIADKYRTSKEMFSNGEWKLNAFYDGLSFYMEIAPEDTWVSFLEKLKTWGTNYPKSVTARVALAECLVGYAFYGRSRAYANDVTDKQWQLFYDRLQQASEVLNQAKSLQQKCPDWWAALQRIALGYGWEKSEYDQLLRSAIEYEPTYYAYHFRAAWHLLPWWHGEEGDWERYAKSAANNVGGQEGDILYTRIVWFLHRRCARNVTDQNPNVDWGRIDKGLKAIKSVYGEKAL
jgi:hypothetical protein